MSWDGITNVSPERAWAALINAHDIVNDALRVNVIAGSITVDSEFPTAATLADNTANPTTTSVATFPHWFDGSTWDRARGDSTDGVLVNLGANNDVTVTGSVTANAGTNLNTSALALESGGNLAAVATSLSVIDDWDESDRAKVNIISGQTGVQGGSGSVSANTQRVVLATDVALPAGNNNIGDVDVASIAAGTNAIGKVGHDTTGISDGRTTVTTAGTRVALASSTTCKWVIITAETDNTGLIVVGGASSVIASLSTRQGTPLYPGDSVTVITDNLADIGLDSTVSTDGVTYQYGT